MASIADLFGRLLLDDSGFEAAVVQSADKAGTKAGQSLGSSLSKSFKAGGLAVLSAVFAGAAKGAIELDTAVNQYAADVGASAEETDKAKDAATELFKTNRQGYDEILQTLARLRTDQGLSIDQADDLAGAYLRFAKVARTDAPTAVTAFDDVLDAFNLKAADGVALMDLLVASNQKYGGTLLQRLADLKTLAPALQGLNLDVNDAVALENLFAASGLDASDALGALKTALKNLQPGQTFDDLIAKVSSIEDPTLRAQKAIEIFGAKGGAALAQALRPGIDSLAEFEIKEGDAAGAAKKASDSIDKSIPAQFQLALKGIMGSLSDLIGPAGAIASVVTGLTSLGVTFDLLKAKAIAGWIATLGPVALIGGAGLAFIAMVDQLSNMTAEDIRAAAAAGELTGAQAKLKAELDAGAITLDEYDSKLSAVKQSQGAQARFAALAAGADNQAADAAAKAAVANDEGATAAERAALASEKLADAQETVASTGTAGAAAAAKTDFYFSLLGHTLPGVTDSMLGAGKGTDTLSDSLLTAANNANIAKLALDGVIQSNLSWEQRNAPGAGTTTGTPGAGLIGMMEARRLFEERQEQLRQERDRQAKADAADNARAARSAVTDSFAAQGRAADAFFDALHRNRLDDIEDARRTANAELEAQKKALFAGVDAAQEALDAKRQAAQRRSLQQDITTAAQGISAAGDDPQAQAAAVARLRDARAALADFDAQAKIDTDRATAQAAVDAITAQQQANDVKAALAVDGENATAAARKKAFDEGLKKLEDDLLTEKGSHTKTLAAITKLYVDAGISSKSQGAQIALGLAAGLLSEIAAVESAAKTLAKAVSKYIKIGSPAEAGPFHDTEPFAMGKELTTEWWRGVVAGIPSAGLGGALGGPADALSLPSIAQAYGGPVAPMAAMADVPSLDGGPLEVEIHQTLDIGDALYGSNRFIDNVSRGLAFRRRGTG